MRLSDARQVVREVHYKCPEVPLALIGPTSAGKTQMLKELARDEKWKFVDLRLSTHPDTGDLIGMMKIEGDKTIWLPPCWWPDPDEHCLIDLEEVNRAPAELRQAVFQLVNERRFHVHELGRNSQIVMAVNPVESGEYDVASFDRAFIRRFAWIVVEPTVEEWLHWADANQFPRDEVEFIASNPEMLRVPEEVSLEFVKPTPYGWELVKKLSAIDVPEPVFAELVRGCVGIEAAAKYMRYRQGELKKPATADDVLKHYPEKKKEILAQPPELQAATVRLLLVECNKRKLTPAEGKNLCDYLVDMGNDFTAKFILDADSKTSAILVKDDRLHKFCKEVRS